MSHAPGQVLDVLGEMVGRATSTVPLYSFQSAQLHTAIANSKPSSRQLLNATCAFQQEPIYGHKCMWCSAIREQS